VRSPLSGLAPARRRLVVVLLGILAVALVTALGTFTVTELRGGSHADQSRLGPVIVVPGYGGGITDLAPLIEELRREGREAVVFVPTGGGKGDLRVQARRLGALADRTLSRTGDDSVDVVGYSAGGVVIRLWIRDDDGASVVRRVLTLGSPHHGTDVAALAQEVAGGCPAACEQLATGSDLLRRLDAGDETPDGPSWVTVRTDDDDIVTPSDSAMLEGALNIRVQDLCPAATTSHGQLPSDPVVRATLSSVLGRPTPAVPQDITC
jgi:triacylglycerol lipase